MKKESYKKLLKRNVLKRSKKIVVSILLISSLFSNSLVFAAESYKAVPEYRDILRKDSHSIEEEYRDKIKKVVSIAADKIIENYPKTFSNIQGAGVQTGLIEFDNDSDVAQAYVRAVISTSDNYPDSIEYRLMVDVGHFRIKGYEFLEGNKNAMLETLSHETMHIMMYEALTLGMTGRYGGTFPGWFIEGMATVAGGGTRHIDGLLRTTSKHTKFIHHDIDYNTMKEVLSKANLTLWRIPSMRKNNINQVSMYGVGYLSLFYLGQLIADIDTFDDDTEVDVDKVRLGLDSLMHTIAKGYSLDEAINKKTKGRYTNVKDFEENSMDEVAKFSVKVIKAIKNGRGSTLADLDTQTLFDIDEEVAMPTIIVNDEYIGVHNLYPTVKQVLKGGAYFQNGLDISGNPPVDDEENIEEDIAGDKEEKTEEEKIKEENKGEKTKENTEENKKETEDTNQDEASESEEKKEDTQVEKEQGKKEQENEKVQVGKKQDGSEQRQESETQGESEKDEVSKTQDKSDQEQVEKEKVQESETQGENEKEKTSENQGKSVQEQVEKEKVQESETQDENEKEKASENQSQIENEEEKTSKSQEQENKKQAEKEQNQKSETQTKEKQDQTKKEHTKGSDAQSELNKTNQKQDKEEKTQEKEIKIKSEQAQVNKKQVQENKIFSSSKRRSSGGGGGSSSGGSSSSGSAFRKNKKANKTQNTANINTIYENSIKASVDVKNINHWSKNKDNKWTYTQNASLLTSLWLKYNNNWYYLDKSGQMLANTWLYNANKWYFIKSDGIMSSKEWVLVNGKWYYADIDGTILINTKKLIDNKEYKFDQTGAFIK